MSRSARRPQQIYTIVMWILSVIFAGFLIGLGNLIIADLPRMDRSIAVSDFADQAALERIETAQSQAGDRSRILARQAEDARMALSGAQSDYDSASVTYQNWLSTRSVTEADAQNPEVLARTRQVERLQSAVRTAEQNVEEADRALRNHTRAVNDLKRDRTDILNQARPAYQKAKRGQELRVFLMRLAVTLPLLLIGGWLLAKKRGSAYWPLYRGFVLAALFAFFIELVPYLPSYGGYVRYGVGIILVAVFGHFIIRAMRSYLARKQEEETRSEGERRRSIAYETALKKLAAGTCPGCDRTIITRDGVQTDFCVHCGIRLHEDCRSCGQRNVSFHKFCLSCGTEKEAPAPTVS